VKIIAESYGLDFTPVDSLHAGFNRARRFTKSELKTGIIVFWVRGNLNVIAISWPVSKGLVV
jgi:hypothetical protein